MEIYDRIKILRKQNLNLSQEEFANRLGVTRSVISNIEYNVLAKPEQKEPLYRLICSTFGVNYDWLKTGEGDIFAQSEENFINELAAKYPNECDGLLKRIISLYIKLNSEERGAIQKYIDALSTPPPEPDEETRTIYKAASSSDDEPDKIMRMSKRELDELESLPEIENDDEL